MREHLLNTVLRADAMIRRLTDSGMDEAMFSEVCDIAESVERILSDVKPGSRKQVEIALGPIDDHIETYPDILQVDLIAAMRRLRDIIAAVA